MLVWQNVFSDVDCEYTFVVECKQFNNIHTKPFSCNKQSHTLNVKVDVSQPKNKPVSMINELSNPLFMLK